MEGRDIELGKKPEYARKIHGGLPRPGGGRGLGRIVMGSVRNRLLDQRSQCKSVGNRIDQGAFVGPGKLPSAVTVTQPKVRAAPADTGIWPRLRKLNLTRHY